MNDNVLERFIPSIKALEADHLLTNNLLAAGDATIINKNYRFKSEIEINGLQNNRKL
ncbi:MAG: hypothetical protein L3J71_00685 [Victivallaceae bacterium]|nr:hypothetical protein [Victivallaceae bacterium]